MPVRQAHYNHDRVRPAIVPQASSEASPMLFARRAGPALIKNYGPGLAERSAPSVGGDSTDLKRRYWAPVGLAAILVVASSAIGCDHEARSARDLSGLAREIPTGTLSRRSSDVTELQAWSDSGSRQYLLWTRKRTRPARTSVVRRIGRRVY